MKKLTERLGILCLVASVSMMVGCNSDDIDDTIDDIINQGPTLSDGYYIVGSAVSADTTDANLLVGGQVNASDFGIQDRSGFFEGYLYMESGDFSFIKVVGEEITELGGSAEEMTGGDPDPITIYTGQYEEGGTGTSPVDGSLVHVSIDETTGQFVIIPVDYWEVIGSATEGGWGAGQEIAQVSASSDEVLFEGTEIILRSGEYKFRFNSTWSMNLEEDESCDVAVTACYNYFTNFGGTVSELVHGGSNIVFDGTDGAFTIQIKYTPGEGNSIAASITRTGDAPEITFDPAEYNFGIIGDATAGAWDSDQNMYYKGQIEGAHTWLAVVTLAESGNLKFRTNDDWAFNLGGSLLGDGTESTLAQDGADIASPGAGAYYIALKTADEGETWTATMVSGGWGVIGEGSPQGNWDADIDMTADDFETGVTTYTITDAFTTGEWKFRAGDSWDYNLGGDLSALSPDGANITLSEAGTYTVVLSYDGEVYSVTATLQ